MDQTVYMAITKITMLFLEISDDPGYVRGLENPNEFVNIARWMIKHGYSDPEIAKVMGLNAIKLLEKVW